MAVQLVVAGRGRLRVSGPVAVVVGPIIGPLEEGACIWIADHADPDGR